MPVDGSIVNDMHKADKFESYLGDERYYFDWLAYYQAQIDKLGWQGTLNKHVFAGDEHADDMLVRMFAGFLHPIIHLGFGVEFQQPAIIAEALAQACIHTNWMGKLLLPAEKAANEHPPQQSKSVVQLLDEIRADRELSTAAYWDDGNKIRDGIIARAADKMIKYASQYKISDPSSLEEKNAEMTNAVTYYTGAAQRPGKEVKIDFYYMHCLNCSVFFPAFLKADWLSQANKVRLLEWKVRNDLAMYASRRSPELLIDEIVNYIPKQPSEWNGVFERVKNYEEDGHASKIIRALAHGQQVCKPYQSKEEFRIKDAMWLQLAHMSIDSVEGQEFTWVRSAGFDQAWESVPDRPRAQL